MTTACQNVATYTTAIIRTTQTVFLATSTQQIAGLPTTSTITVPSPSCSTSGTGSSASVRCTTYTSSRITVITPAPSQVQVVVTVTNQVVQTQLNTLFGTLCRTVTGPDPPGVTDTTYTTEYVTVSGTNPTPTSTTPGSSRTSLSRNTVFGDPTSESDPSGTAVGAGSSEPGSSNVPVAAIVGGVVGGLAVAALLGFLVYFLFLKKSIAAKGYKAPGEESPSSYHDNEQSDVFSSEQTGYYAQGYDGQGQGHTSGQPNPGQPQFQGSYPTQYADSGQGAHYPQSQGSGSMYADTQGAQYPSPEMNQVPFNTASGVFPAAVVAGAALPVVAAASLSHYSSSSSPPPGSSVAQYSPQSQLSTIPLVHHSSPHQHPMSHTPVPYRGYAEPGDA